MKDKHRNMQGVRHFEAESAERAVERSCRCTFRRNGETPALLRSQTIQASLPLLLSVCSHIWITFSNRISRDSGRLYNRTIGATRIHRCRRL